jgi:hypothetical protein
MCLLSSIMFNPLIINFTISISSEQYHFIRIVFQVSQESHKQLNWFTKSFPLKIFLKNTSSVSYDKGSTLKFMKRLRLHHKLQTKFNLPHTTLKILTSNWYLQKFFKKFSSSSYFRF